MVTPENFKRRKNEIAAVWEISPEFGPQTTNSIVIESDQLMSFEQQLQEKREQRLKANGDFLKQLNKLTFGDFKKHESPNRRLIEQKTETVKHKKVLKRHDSLKKGIHYTVGVDKSYVIQ